MPTAQAMTAQAPPTATVSATQRADPLAGDPPAQEAPQQQRHGGGEDRPLEGDPVRVAQEIGWIVAKRQPGDGLMGKVD